MPSGRTEFRRWSLCAPTVRSPSAGGVGCSGYETRVIRKYDYIHKLNYIHVLLNCPVREPAVWHDLSARAPVSQRPVPANPVAVWIPAAVTILRGIGAALGTAVPSIRGHRGRRSTWSYRGALEYRSDQFRATYSAASVVVGTACGVGHAALACILPDVYAPVRVARRSARG